MLLLFAASLLFTRAVGVLFSTTPQSRNVTAGTMVEFTCAAPASGLTSFGMSTTPTVEGSVNDGNDLPNGDRQVILSFIAPSDQTSISIVCVAITTTAFNQSFAVLMIQGLLSPVCNLTNTTVDSCTLHFSWVAPSSLERVAINYFINITDNDRMLLKSITTNTTEYFYSVSSLGETLEVVVAAVNGVGTGNAKSIMIQTPSSISAIEIINIKNTIRTNGTSKNTNWTYSFNIKDKFVCGNAISHVIVKVCLNSSCTSTNGTVDLLPDGERRVMATFTDLMENRKYTATLNINYNGGVVQQSQPVEISTFDVHNVTLNGPVVRGRVCLNVTYVEGHELPAECYIVFRCSTTGHDMYHATIQGSSMCIPNVPAHPSYTIIATDGDAVDEINTTAPVTILGVVVPEYTVILSSSTSPRATPTPTPTESIIIGESLSLTVVIVPLAFAIIVISGTIFTLFLFMVWWCKKQNRGTAKECVTGATNPPPVLYENIDPLSQSSVQTAPSYENIPAVAFSPQSSNIEMKECPAYGVVTRT